MAGRMVRIALVMGLFWVATLAVAVLRQGAQDEVDAADAIVVLGAAQWNGRPSPVLRARLDHGIALYHAGAAPLLITTGGHGPDPHYTEAGVGRAYAEARGVPATALLSEEVGTTTWESMRAVAAIAEARGIRRVLLVSDPFHMARLKAMARDLGLEPLTSPTRSSPISRRPLVEMRYVVREVVLLTGYHLDQLLRAAGDLAKSVTSHIMSG